MRSNLDILQTKLIVEAVMGWWQGTPMRLVQTNLREIDLPFDPRAYAQSLAEMGANVVLFNLGGIVANYPTRLPYHYRNPLIKEDMVGELIQQLHNRNIRLIGRFDFSKVNQVIGALHPDWLYRSLKGEAVIYNGQMHCCVNGAYQQDCSRAILEEALDLYPLDGVFFNMIGYQTSDYSGVYHGLCQCENCRTRFQAYCGQSLPTREDRSDPVYQHYLRFCSETSRELFHHIRDTIKHKRPDCAICTYTSDGVDIVRTEANSGLRRAQPEFVYDASLSVRRVRASWPALASSNAAVHFIDYPYRHAAVSPALTARRLAQDFIHGGWLDYYVIGHLDRQNDRACLPGVKHLFHLHRRAEPWLANSQPLADVCIIEAGPANPGRNPEELRGLVTLLSEAHVLYDVVQETALGPDAFARLACYSLVIIPDVPHLSPGLVAALNRYVQDGGRLLLTGLSGSLSADGQPLNNHAIACAGVSAIHAHPHVPGAYFAIREPDRALLPALEAIDWLPADSAWLECLPEQGSRVLLQYIPAGMYGPPEKCYYTEVSDHPGIIMKQMGQGRCVILPWQIGSQYWRFPTDAVTGLFQAVLASVLELHSSLLVEAPPLVEVSAFRTGDGGLLIGLVNLGGQNGRAVHNPPPLAELSFRVPSFQGAGRVETLTQGEIPSRPMPDGSLVFTLPSLALLELLRVG